MFDDNRRKYPRVNATCQLILWPINGSDETILANLSNLGVGGLCVLLNESFDVGTKVDIELYLESTTTPFKCHGKIVRSVLEATKLYNTGIEFSPLGELKHAFLEAKIAEIIAFENKGKI